MTRVLSLLLAMSFATACTSPGVSQRAQLVAKVEHVYLVSENAESLFTVFRDQLRLPVVWPYTSYGGFASGGLTLGNVVMEFVAEPGARAGGVRSAFKGIAFEPAADADAAVAELERRGISHGKPDPYTYTADGRERVGWVTVALTRFPPAGSSVFLCDYKNRVDVASGRAKASSELAASGGGPMGVTSLREIVVGVKSIRDASRQWGKLLEVPSPDMNELFVFGTGPAVRLVREEAEGIHSIIVGVRSREIARQFLIANRMLGGENNEALSIAPAAVGGLRIILVED